MTLMPLTSNLTRKTVVLTVDENGRPLRGNGRYVRINLTKEMRQLLLQIRREQRQVQKQVESTLKLIDNLLSDSDDNA